jgi:hypothetical protein
MLIPNPLGDKTNSLILGLEFADCGDFLFGFDILILCKWLKTHIKLCINVIYP